MSQKKNITGIQFTVAWYIDDNKASHVDSRVIDDLLDTIKTHFGGNKNNEREERYFSGYEH